MTYILLLTTAYHNILKIWELLFSRTMSSDCDIHSHACVSTELRNFLYMIARMMQGQDGTEVISNSRNKLHQITYKEIFSALYVVSEVSVVLVGVWCSLLKINFGSCHSMVVP